MSKSTILLIFSIIVIVVLAAVSFAVYRDRQESGGFNVPGLTAKNQPADQSGGHQGSIDDTQPVGSVGERSVCGDGKCTGTETVETCYSDCTLRDVFISVTLTDTSDTSVLVEWTTVRPMTSVLDYGNSREYELGTLNEPGFSTEHSIEITGLSAPNNYYIRLRGIDENGQEETFRGPSFEL